MPIPPTFALLEQTSPSYVAARALQTLNEMLRRGFTTVVEPIMVSQER
jgi:cytosine/adenosine deaminase-related metal-dependent hydrolase